MDHPIGMVACPAPRTNAQWSFETGPVAETPKVFPTSDDVGHAPVPAWVVAVGAVVVVGAMVAPGVAAEVGALVVVALAMGGEGEVVGCEIHMAPRIITPMRRMARSVAYQGQGDFFSSRIGW